MQKSEKNHQDEGHISKNFEQLKYKNLYLKKTGKESFQISGKLSFVQVKFKFNDVMLLQFLHVS